MKAARVTANAPSESLEQRRADDGVTRAAGGLAERMFWAGLDAAARNIEAGMRIGYYLPRDPVTDDDSDFEGRETYQDGIEDISPFTVAVGDDDELFVIEMSQKKGCLRCGATFFARGKCLQCGADDPGKQIMGCG